MGGGGGGGGGVNGESFVKVTVTCTLPEFGSQKV